MEPFVWLGAATKLVLGAGTGLVPKETLEVEPLCHILRELESGSLVFFIFSEARRGIDSKGEFGGLGVKFSTWSLLACSTRTKELRDPSWKRLVSCSRTCRVYIVISSTRVEPSGVKNSNSPSPVEHLRPTSILNKLRVRPYLRICLYGHSWMLLKLIISSSRRESLVGLSM